jgi:CBS domain containing-hemolysin-like protein
VALVGFLHVVVGEMAPKSWAISHPESSAQLLAIPLVGFTTILRPVLAALNGLANACLKLVKVTPQDELAQVHSAEQLRMLIETSKEHGTIPDAEHELLTAMLAVESTTVRDVMTPTTRIVSVPTTAGARDVELRSIEAGRSRLAVTSEDGAIAGIVHVREAAKAVGTGSGATAGRLMTSALRLPAGTSGLDAIAAMRRERNQVALVTEADVVIGLVALEDLLEQVIGQFDDETDPVIDAARRAGRTSRSGA